MNEKLVAKVKAVNNAHKTANYLKPTLVKIFTPFVGQKIETNNGQLLAKIQKLLPAFPHTPALHIYRHVSNYSLAFTIKTCEPIQPNSCTYYEATVYLGDLQNGVLTKINDTDASFRTNYTPEEITTKRQTYEKAKKAADQAYSNLHPFGEYDR